VLEVLYHRNKFGEARITLAAGAAKKVEIFVCLSVCLSVRRARGHACLRVTGYSGVSVAAA